MRFSVFLLLILAIPGVNAGTISDRQASEIGRRIWQNECAGTISGLTSWNKGEEFPSLGIAHFIWYPAAKRGPFEESFPGLVRFLKANDQPVKPWMEGACPWSSRAAFVSEINGPRLSELRKLLAGNVPLQARYAALRLEAALPKMLAAAPAGERARVSENFCRVAAEPLGYYALMDYVNFKGEGTNPSERYAGTGWGLLQVLTRMSPSGPALPAFVRAADEVLTLRVKNSPPPRNEAQWLPGWRNRMKTYLE
ncbi:MAG: hypothetical protein D4R65_13405 [Verrucomicrobiaceae bacterium]|nr:MAG: hypothetical protein D4R65_13405 [Verrucomicrobiaceae bacterium]